MNCDIYFLKETQKGYCLRHIWLQIWAFCWLYLHTKEQYDIHFAKLGHEFWTISQSYSNIYICTGKSFPPKRYGCIYDAKTLLHYTCWGACSPYFVTAFFCPALQASILFHRSYTVLVPRVFPKVARSHSRMTDGGWLTYGKAKAAGTGRNRKP